MFAVLPVDVAVHDIIDMPVVWDRLMFATDAVVMIRRMRGARVRSARQSVGGSELVLHDSGRCGMMQMAVVQIIDVLRMAHGDVAAPWAVVVIVIVVEVRVRSGHRFSITVMQRAHVP